MAVAKTYEQYLSERGYTKEAEEQPAPIPEAEAAPPARPEPVVHIRAKGFTFDERSPIMGQQPKGTQIEKLIRENWRPVLVMLAGFWAMYSVMHMGAIFRLVRWGMYQLFGPLLHIATGGSF